MEKTNEQQICQEDLLRRMTPEEIEREGDRYNWWYVCPECHGAIDDHDRFCRHCGQAFLIREE